MDFSAAQLEGGLWGARKGREVAEHKHGTTLERVGGRRGGGGRAQLWAAGRGGGQLSMGTDGALPKRGHWFHSTRYEKAERINARPSRLCVEYSNQL